MHFGEGGNSAWLRDLYVVGWMVIPDAVRDSCIGRWLGITILRMNFRFLHAKGSAIIFSVTVGAMCCCWRGVVLLPCRTDQFRSRPCSRDIMILRSTSLRMAREIGGTGG
jgi:hypothetical protein